MEEIRNKSNLSALLSFTNLLGLAVIIALSLVIKILLDQKESVKDQNVKLFAQVEEKNIALNDLTTENKSLETKVKDLIEKQGCDSYISELERLKNVEKELSKAKNDYIQSLEYTQSQTKEIGLLAKKVEILESIVGDNNQRFPN